MTRIEHSVWINSSPEAVWDFGLNSGYLPEWFVGVENVWVADNYPEIGSTMEIVFRVAGVEVPVTMVVEELQPYDRLVFSMSGMISGTQEWYHQPQDGGVTLTHINDYEPGGGILSQIADRLVVERQAEKQLIQSLDNYKAMVEG